MNMASILLFLRTGYVVGNAGLLEGFLMLCITYVLLICTVTSVCAIATNGAVETGGLYYMLSRTLGTFILKHILKNQILLKSIIRPSLYYIDF